MKAKLKGQSGIKGLLLLHGEKLIMGLFVLAAGYLLYASLQVQGLPDQFEPSKLEAEVKRTRANMDQNTWDRIVREHPDKVKLSSESIKTEVFSVDHVAYRSPALNPRVLAKIEPRVDPVLLSAADVRATAGADLFAFEDTDTRGRYELREQESAHKKEQKRLREQEEQKEARNATQPGRGNRGGRQSDEQRGAGFDPDHPNRWAVSRQTIGAPLAGGELVELNRWVSVVAKVPTKGQMQQYRKAFENASGGFNPDTDYPVYYGYLVQRAEYQPGVAPDALKWQSVPVTDARGTPHRATLSSGMNLKAVTALETAKSKWIGGPGLDPVHPSYLSPDGYLAYPLPPIVGRDWGREVTHPDIPLAADEIPAAATTTTPDAALATPLAGTSPEGFGGPATGGITPGRDPRMGTQPIGRDPRESGRAPERAPQRQRSSPGGRDTRDTGGGGGRMGAGSDRFATAAAPVSDVDFYLLRFFDFTAEPGKRYVYRVQLVLSDPNLRFFNLPSALDGAVVARLRKLQDASGKLPTAVAVSSPWSEPSPPVGIPLEGRVRLAAVTPGDDPKVNLLVDGFGMSPQAGVWVQASKIKENLSRGSVVNFSEDSEYLLETRDFVDRYDGKFSFVTGVTVLDARGGERLGRGDLTAPARVLVMDPSGELKIRCELDDAHDVQQFRETFTKPKPTASGRSN